MVSEQGLMEHASSHEVVEDVCSACLSSTRTNDLWYIDSGASSHMIGHKHYFSNLSEKEFGFEILLGDDYAIIQKESEL